MNILEEAIILCEILNNHGFKAHFVGGIIRDIILGRPFKDIDITTDATPEQVYAIFIDKYYVAPTGENLVLLVLLNIRIIKFLLKFIHIVAKEDILTVDILMI